MDTQVQEDGVEQDRVFLMFASKENCFKGPLLPKLNHMKSFTISTGDFASRLALTCWMLRSWRQPLVVQMIALLRWIRDSCRTAVYSGAARFSEVSFFLDVKRAFVYIGTTFLHVDMFLEFGLIEPTGFCRKPLSTS